MVPIKIPKVSPIAPRAMSWIQKVPGMIPGYCIISNPSTRTGMLAIQKYLNQELLPDQIPVISNA
jgi:hypothetical protein